MKNAMLRYLPLVPLGLAALWLSGCSSSFAAGATMSTPGLSDEIKGGAAMRLGAGMGGKNGHIELLLQARSGGDFVDFGFGFDYGHNIALNKETAVVLNPSIIAFQAGSYGEANDTGGTLGLGVGLSHGSNDQRHFLNLEFSKTLLEDVDDPPAQLMLLFGIRKMEDDWPFG